MNNKNNRTKKAAYNRVNKLSFRKDVNGKEIGRSTIVEGLGKVTLSRNTHNKDVRAFTLSGADPKKFHNGGNYSLDTIAKFIDKVA